MLQPAIGCFFAARTLMKSRHFPNLSPRLRAVR